MERMPENGEIIPQGDERKLLARFYKHAIKNEARTIAEGRPMFDEKVFVSIIIPGDKNTRVEREMRDEDKERFPRAWAAFQNADTVSLTGTPVEQWPPLSVTQVAELKAMNILTVEHLAELSDSITQKMMGLGQLRTQAQAYIKAAKDGSHAQALATELAKRDDEIARLNGVVADLGARLDALDKSPKRPKPAMEAA